MEILNLINYKTNFKWICNNTNISIYKSFRKISKNFQIDQSYPNRSCENISQNHKINSK